ncbi:hypothetical protein Godav_000242 [Gossypium davidsonii]|uniref:Uncharacterized protein n=1 Tax=Gossypium davidsonii TaxID=34287 RepID=A0A7J8SZ23_GOSDV|nr:hypothetical protein [Gossypium davidsonii]
MKNCSNINQSAKHNGEYCQGDAWKTSLTEIVGEENGKSIDLNFELTPIGLPSKDHFVQRSHRHRYQKRHACF